MKIVIVGAGEVGYHIASRLAHEQKDVVVIDKNADSLKRISDNIDVQVIQGSGGSPLTLEEAGIRDAEILLAVTDSDESNLIACLISDILSPTTKKLARLRDFDYDKYHETFQLNAPHIDKIINPEVELIKTIDNMMSVPGSVDIGEFADGRVKFVGIHLHPEARLAGVRLTDIPEKIGKRILIAAIVRDDELIIPRGNDRLKAGDVVYFISEKEKLTETLQIFDKHTEPVNRVLIIGGGRTGLRLAELLESKSISVKIIEKNAKRCQELAEQLDKTIILHGDGSDQRLLKEENIQDMDFVVSLTNDEETNILTSLLVRRLGAKKSITKVGKFSYFQLMRGIGMELVVNSRLSAINSILQHIRRGKVLSAITLKGEQGEVMEAVALETSDIVGKPLKKIALPKGSLVTGIIRSEDVIIPSGDSVILPGDRIIIFARKEAIPKVEKILMVKLEYF